MNLHGYDIRIWLLALIGIAVGLTVYLAGPEYRATAGAATAGIIVLIVLKHLGMLLVVASPFGALARTLRQRARAIFRSGSGEDQ